jgi:RimJ/RimL family protein N-acetyltransferase
MTTPEPPDRPVTARADEDQTLILRDGSSVAIRTMGADDEERLLRFHHRLSRETIRRRFFAIHPELSPAELYRFTHVDHLDREAIIALADDEIVAVARFDRIGRGASAEVAFVVADDWQGRGLVTVLLTRLARRAGQVGIEQFVAETLPENRAMLTVFRHAGLPTTERFERGVVHVTIDLSRRTSAPGTPPDT